jgi:tetratricopeptide (TPR) repeat protein
MRGSLLRNKEKALFSILNFGIKIRSWKSFAAAVLFGAWFAASAQSAQTLLENMSAGERGQALMEQGLYAEAEGFFSQWVMEESANPNAHYWLALSRSLQEKLESALTEFKKAIECDPKMAEAYFEIAGVYFKKKEYRESLSWARAGLRLQPESSYGLDLTGTLYFLMDSKIEALDYWNRIDKPYLAEMNIRSSTAIDRQLIADEIALKPGSLLSRSEIGKAQWRLRQHEYIRGARFIPVPTDKPEHYSMDVQIDARSGFGTPIEFIANSISNIGFQKFRLTYWNLAKTGITINMPFRLKSSARWAQLEIQAPRPGHLDIYTKISYAWRDELWDLNRAGSEVMDSSRLRTHELAAAVLIPIREPLFVLNTEIRMRRRLLEFHEPVSSASAVVSKAISGISKEDARTEGRHWQWVTWYRFSPQLHFANHGSSTGWGWNSSLRAGIDFGRRDALKDKNISRFCFSWDHRFSHTAKAGLQSNLHVGLHAGRVSEAADLEDYYRLGVGPDADFQLRAHPVFRDGIFGSAPLAGEFLLGNITVRQSIYSGEWIHWGLSIFCDTAWTPRLYTGQEISSTAVDTGAGIEIGLLGSAGPRFTLAYGRDWKGQRNAFYLSAGF